MAIAAGGLGEVVGGGAPSGGDGGGSLRVSTLLGHAHVEMALFCLGSLRRFSALPVRLRVHDDGTLTGGDLERLAAGLGEPEVVLRGEADERLAGFLGSRPATRAFREGNALGLKLVDAVLLADGAERVEGAGGAVGAEGAAGAAGAALAYCDSDVLFLRPFRRLFEVPAGCGAVFMSDPQNAYSVRSWQLVRERRLRLAGRVNSGIIGFRTRCYDPDLVEWFLSRPEYRFAPVWVEQTCWALLGQAAGCRLLDPTAVGIPVPGRAVSPATVALHFVSPVRYLLERHRGAADVAGAPAAADTGPVEVATLAAPRLTAFALAASEVRRRLRRLGLQRGGLGG